MKGKCWRDPVYVQMLLPVDLSPVYEYVQVPGHRLAPLEQLELGWALVLPGPVEPE
jgi:hypothetical protein